MKTYLYPIFLVICWSCSYVWTSMALESFYPITILVMRIFMAAVLLLALSLWLKKLQSIRREHLLWFIGLALLEPFGYFLCEIYGLTMISPTLAAVILSTIPLFSPVVAWFALRERITWLNWLGIVVSLAGVLIISIDGNGTFSGRPLGIALIFGAVLISITYSVSLKRLAEDYSELSIVTYQNVFGMVLFLPLFFLVDFGKPMLPVSARSVGAVLLLVVFASSVAFLLYAVSLKRLGVSRTNMFLNLLPAVTAVVAFLLLGETLPARKIIGIAVVIIGLFVGQMPFRKASLSS